MLRTIGTKAEVEAYIGLVSKALGLPSVGTEVGPGPHVPNESQRRSLGMVTATDLDGNEVIYEAWETLYDAHVPFTTTAWDVPRKHPTKELYDCAAFNPANAIAPLTISERAELQTKYSTAEPAKDEWTQIEAIQ